MPFAPSLALPPPAWRVGAVLTLIIVASSGCGPRGRGPGGAGAPPPRAANGDDRAEAGYLPPPRLVSASRSPTTIVLMGSAAPGARVEMMAPEGGTMSTSTDPSGAWRMTLPGVIRPRMFALAARMKGGSPDNPGPGERLVHSEGALILLPRTGPPALLVRAGAGALVFASRTVRPSLDALDYDPGGFSAAAGRAPPGGSVRLLLDGALAGVGQADRGGRFSILAANRRLSFGSHVALVQSDNGQDERRFTVSPPGPTLTTPYQADATPEGWRIEWAIPGGGVQTTMVFIPAG